MRKVHEDDAKMAEKLKGHHAIMIEDLDRLSGAFAAAAASEGDVGAAKRALEEWIAKMLVPHAEEEEATTYRAAAELLEGELLIQGMLAEHELIRRTAAHMSAAEAPIEAATYGRALFDIFDSHQRKENDMILPLLVDSNTVSLSEIMNRAGHGHDDEHGHGHRT